MLEYIETKISPPCFHKCCLGLSVANQAICSYRKGKFQIVIDRKGKFQVVIERENSRKSRFQMLY